MSKTNAFTGPGVEKLQIKVGGLSCSFCAASINKALGRMDGVRSATVNLAHEEALVEYEPAKVTPARLKETLLELGYTIRDASKVRSFEEEEAEIRRERNKLLIAAGFALMTLGAMAFMWLGFAPMERRPRWMDWLMPALALATIFGPGWHILTMAFASLKRGILNQHVLLEFGAFAGLIGGFLAFVNPAFPLPDFFGVAVFITTYHLLSGYVSLKVRTRSSQAVKKLLALVPATARVVRDGREEEVPVAEIMPGELVRIRPGESIPVDGEVVEGAAGVDESLVTGESMPREKEPGDAVIGGSVNQTGALLVRVTRVGEESFLQQVARQVEEARALKPAILALVDRILEIYVPTVLGVAALAVVIWTLGAWLVTGSPDFTRAIFAALAVLVMGYPCALGMATPLAMIRGGGMAAERGILMRSAEAFQILKEVRRVVLDKTGTITRGAPTVVDIVPLAGQGRQEALRVAAAAERFSEHPLARAVVEAAEQDGLTISTVEDFSAVSGKGVTARVEGRRVAIGSPKFVASQGVDLTVARAQIESLQAAGNTVIALAADGAPAALIAIADQIKDDAPAAIAQMKAAGLEPVMLTGDNARTARAVAERVGIANYRAEVLPDDKAAAVRELQQQGHRVAMVGDGINDAPALMQADVGLAIGAGTDIAIESADVVLIGERLGAVVDAYHIGRASYRKTVQNLSLAFAFNGIGVPLAVTGLLHPVWAMVAMIASVTTVLTNSFAGRLVPMRRQGSEARLELTIPNMRCEHCLAAIRAAATALPGVTNVAGDPATQRVTVSYSTGIAEPDGIREAIIERGFKVAQAQLSSAPPNNKLTKGGHPPGARPVWPLLRGAIVALLIAAAAAAALRFTVFRPPLVSVAEITLGDVADEVEGTGTVTADVLTDIASKITGRLEQVFVNEGDPVEKGEVVAMLDETDLRRQAEAARARLAGARVAAEERQREWNRERRLVASRAVSVEDSQQHEERVAVAQRAVEAAQAELEAAEYNLSLAKIPALFSGLVIKRRVVPGASVVPGQPMFTVADTSLIYVNAFVDQNFSGKLRKGEPAAVILRGRENQPLPGHVLRISPQADAATEETVAEVAFTIPRDEFQLGQWANVFIQVGEARNALIVPQAATMPMDNKTFLFVVGENDVLRREAVTVLAESPRRPMVAVAGNLRLGERVVLMPMGLTAGQAVRPRLVEKKQAMESAP